MTTLQITKGLTATILVNQDGSIFISTNYNNDIRRYFYENVKDVIENSSIVAVKNYFINQ